MRRLQCKQKVRFGSVQFSSVQFSSQSAAASPVGAALHVQAWRPIPVTPNRSEAVRLKQRVGCYAEVSLSAISTKNNKKLNFKIV